MSKFSGKCDLYDHVYMIGNSGDKTELELFNEFKEATNGVLYQHIKVPIDKNNFDNLVESEKATYGDKYDLKYCLGKDNEGNYYYYGKKFRSIKTLAKNFDYYMRKEIHFEKFIDLIKYYPYLISMSSSYKDDDGKRHSTIYITNDSYIDIHENEMLVWSLHSKHKIYDYYRNELINEYIRVVKEYY